MEKSIRHKKRKECIKRIPKTLHEFSTYLYEEEWKQLLLIDTADSFLVEVVVKNSETKAVILIDKMLIDTLIQNIPETLTMFVDGTFAMFPKLQNTNSVVDNCS